MTDPLYSPAYFSALRRKADSFGWAAHALEEFGRQTAAKLDKPFDIPLLGGGWSHDYNCPNEGDRLQRIDRHHHKCPSCGTVWSGSPWDEVAVANDHWHYAVACRDAAVLYGIGGDLECLAYARRVLLFYADHYEQYPLHDKRGGQTRTAGKVQCQTLSEASWLAPLAQACYILQQLNALSREEQLRLTSGLFEPAVRVIKQNPAGMSNWQTYHNAAKIWTAAVTGNRELFEEALHDPANGFFFQMENSLADDGFWYEGAWGYHFYTLEAQVLIVLAAGCLGVPLHEHPRFRAMFQAPLACMLPNGKLPPVHDSGEVDVSRYAHLYEYAFSHWGEGRELIAESARSSLYSLLFGVGERMDQSAEHAAAGKWTTHDLKRAGMLFVKGGEDAKSGKAAMIDYGPHGGGHGHRDKLNLLYYAKGHAWLSDAGTLPYGNEAHQKYFKQTIAHNTVCIGGKSQLEAEGRLLYARETEGGFEFAAEADCAYPDTIFRRKVMVADDYLADVFEVECPRPETIDWILHTEGELVEEGGNVPRPATMPDSSLGEEDGYAYLRSIRPIAADGGGSPWRLRWRWASKAEDGAGGDCLEVYGFPATPKEQLWTADSPAMPAVGKRHALIRRCPEASRVTFITVLRACCEGEGTAPLRILIKEEEIQIMDGSGRTRSFSTTF